MIITVLHYTLVWEILIFDTILFFFFLFRAVLVAYASSQARGRVQAAAAGLHHSHSNEGIQAASPTYTTAHSNNGSLTLNEARDQTHILMDTSGIHNPLSPNRNS